MRGPEVAGDGAPELEAPPGSGASEVVLGCEELGKRFGDSWVLRGVDLSVARGEILGVIGPGGHGKSVLLKCLAGLVRPDEGAVAVLGQQLDQLGPKALASVRENYGYLFQNYALFDFMTVADNVAFPLRQQAKPPPEDVIEARVAEILDAVGLGRTLAQFPRELSGGMKKRVGLARATITRPSITLYDDPSAGLDPVTSSRIFRLIDRMHTSESATVVVSHDIDRMRGICHRYVMLQHGRVIFDGPESALASQAPQHVQDFFFGGAQSPGAAS